MTACTCAPDATLCPLHADQRDTSYDLGYTDTHPVTIKARPFFASIDAVKANLPAGWDSEVVCRHGLTHIVAKPDLRPFRSEREALAAADAFRANELDGRCSDEACMARYEFANSPSKPIRADITGDGLWWGDQECD